MSDRFISLTLGMHDTARRKAALEQLATSVNAIGRNGAPSISELLSRIADAAEHDLNRTTELVNEVLAIAAERKPRT
jgi:hypothetical protein